MKAVYPLIKLARWTPADLDGQPVSFDLEIDEERFKGTGTFHVTEVRTGVYISILTTGGQAMSRCIDLSQSEADEIVKSTEVAGFVLLQSKPA